MFKKERFIPINEKELASKNIVQHFLISTTGDGDFYIQDFGDSEKENIKVNEALVNELTDHLYSAFDNDVSSLKKILVISKAEYSRALNKKLRLLLSISGDNTGIYTNDFEDTLYQKSLEDRNDSKSITFINHKALVSVLGRDFDYIFIDSDLHKTLENPISSSKTINGFLSSLLLVREGELIMFDANPEIGKYSITKFKS